MNVWKVSVPSSGIACGRFNGRRGGRAVRLMLVRYVVCGCCAAQLVREHAGASAELVEPPIGAAVIDCKLEHATVPGGLN